MKRALVLLGLLPLVGCLGGTPATDVPEYIPAFPGYPLVTQFSGTDCHTVLAIGDSLMSDTQHYLQAALADTGRCATVYAEALGGTGPAGNGGRVNWQSRLTSLITKHDPDIVVMAFVGNSNETGFDYGSPAWAAEQRQATLNLINTVVASNAKPYVMAMPSAAWFCDFAGFGAVWDDYRNFVRTIAAPVGHGDWSTYLSPGDRFARYMSFSGEVHEIRAGDCTHLSALGSDIAAHVTAAAIQGEWQ